jgi:YQGE family putative transporter
MIIKRLKLEWEQFCELSAEARSLLVSFIAWGIASPLLGIFTNAFIWRQHQGVLALALYNGAWMIGISLMFILNGFVLRLIRLSSMYALGLVLQSASAILLFSLDRIVLEDLIAVGFISGAASGFYWANRNLLSLQVTRFQGRDYFCSIESSLATLLSVISPAVCGWFLQFGFQAVGDGILDRYRALAFITLVIQLIGAWYIVRARFEDFAPKAILLWGASRFWNRARIFTALKGIAEGSGIFIPTLLILRLIGQEGAAGTAQSIATLVASAVMYALSRQMRPHNRHLVLKSGVMLMVLGAVALSLLYSPTSALVYLILETLAIQLLWGAANPMIFDAIDTDHGSNGEPYRYIVDRELFLNLGRLSGVFVVITLSLLCDVDRTLRIAPLILAIATSSLLLFSRGLSSNSETKDRP